MNKSENINELAAALSKAQAEIEGAREECKNDFFKSKYADLASVWEACRKVLPKNQLSVTQFGESENGQDYLVTMLMHASGQWISGRIALMLEKDDREDKDEKSSRKKAGPNMQKLGSAITYARRYGLAAIVGVSPEDDDGNLASNRRYITIDQLAELNVMINGYDHLRDRLLKWLQIKSLELVPYQSFEEVKKATKFEIQKIKAAEAEKKATKDAD